MKFDLLKAALGGCLALLMTNGTADASSNFVLQPQVRTDFPIWVGAGADITLFQHLSFFGGYGYMPRPYSKVVGKLVNSFVNDSMYGDLTRQVLSSNRVFHGELSFKFADADEGWRFGIGAYRVRTGGESNVIDLVEGATHLDLSSLKNLLAQTGNTMSLRANLDLWMFDIHGGYTWKLSDHWSILSGLGVAKVASTKMRLSSSSSDVDSVEAIQSLYSAAESQVRSTLRQYGYVPFVTLGVQFRL
ncbi:MAG: hypothetical protein ACJ763_10090 [Bdellovibrionia bacterium]